MSSLAASDTTASTTLPSKPSATPPSPVSTFRCEPPPGWRSKNYNYQRPIRMMARKRAQQRWSALLSRISKLMRLDASLWTAFVAHANAHYKDKFIAAFRKPMLKCVGPSYGDPCGFCVDLTSWGAFVDVCV